MLHISYLGINISYLSLLKIIFSIFIIVIVIYITAMENFVLKNYIRQNNDGIEMKKSSSSGIAHSVKNLITSITAAVGLTSSVVTIHQYVKNEMIGYNKMLEVRSKELEEENCRKNAVNSKELEYLRDHKKKFEVQFNKLDKLKSDSEKLIIDKERLEQQLLFAKDPLEQMRIKNKITQIDARISKNHEDMIAHLNIIKIDVIIHEDTSEKLYLDTTKINKSMIIDLDTIWDFFESINIFKRIALSLLLLKGVILSSIFSLIFILYGDYILKKYNIESRYPKIAKIIQLRRQFQRYYMILSILMIIFVCIIEIIFSLTILSF